MNSPMYELNIGIQNYKIWNTHLVIGVNIKDTVHTNKSAYVVMKHNHLFLSNIFLKKYSDAWDPLFLTEFS